METMTVRVEVWPVAADDKGIWLCSGEDAWRPALPVPADSEPHGEVELLMAQNGLVQAEVALLHSTSWRTDGTSVVLTYLAVPTCPGPIREHWVGALPISLGLVGLVGRPAPHPAAAPPAPRYCDVLLHGIRHLAFLRETDATASAVLDGPWRTHLDALHPALAGLYQDRAA